MVVRGTLAMLIIFGGLWSAPSPATAASNCRQLDDETPCITLTPDHGPVGTHVRISGHLTPTSKQWRQVISTAHNAVFLVAAFRDNRRAVRRAIGGVCEINVAVAHPRIHVNHAGEIHGSFTVLGGTAGCKRTEGVLHAVLPSTYTLTVGCQACGIADYSLTAGSLPTTGIAARPLIVAALLLLAAGTSAVTIGRRRRGLPCCASRFAA